MGMPNLYTTEPVVQQVLPERFLETTAPLPCQTTVNGMIVVDTTPVFVPDEDAPQPGDLSGP